MRFWLVDIFLGASWFPLFLKISTALSDLIESAHPIVAKTIYPYAFSICTLVTKKEEYAEMLGSFVQHGFDYKDCEYLYIDNSQTCERDAFSGLNLFLQQAQGKYIILCHQYILLLDHDRDHFERCINEMDRIDRDWAILSNAGGINLKWLAMHITQKSGRRLEEKLLPLQVISVDENFILVKKEANLALSANLKGFHMYGTDVCLIADILGYKSYIVNFNLLHKSNGNADASFYALKKALIQKYHKAFKGRFMSTTITQFYISGNTFGNLIYNSGWVLFFVRQYYKFFKKKKQYHKMSEHNKY